jgi:squalene/oxidosqualene cyclase-like protein
MFGSCLNYCALRLLGAPADDPACRKGSEYIKSMGGALYTSSWAKFWLCVLGVYEWEGLPPIPSEMWNLPRWVPFHPGTWWCHCRMVYLPMCYMYSSRFRSPYTSEVVEQLKEEIYMEAYDSINWGEHLHSVADIDNYSPVKFYMKWMHYALWYYEKNPVQAWRESSLDFAINYIMEEDKQTNYVCIGPVNKAIHIACIFNHFFQKEGEESARRHLQPHLARVYDYLWVSEDGMKMNGYNGSQCWDTTFALQAIYECHPSYGLSFTSPRPKVDSRGEIDETMVQQALRYVERTQIQCDEEDRELWFRHQSRGGWPFSTAAHGWPISDCSSEGLKGVLGGIRLYGNYVSPRLTIEDKTGRNTTVFHTVDLILSYQNFPEGGWATYENRRGGEWYELLNPSEAFSDIMIDVSCVECSSACLTALKDFHELFPNHRAPEVLNSLKRGAEFIRSIQRNTGEWYGSWGVCFTYACWFGVEGLHAATVVTDSFSNERENKRCIEKALQFLVGKQRNNGGWGESFRSCENKDYSVDGDKRGIDGESNVVQTAWALLALTKGGDERYRVPIQRGVNYLIKMQNKEGRYQGVWDQEGIMGVFNRNCGISYSAYRYIFPTWALGRARRWLQKFGSSED